MGTPVKKLSRDELIVLTRRVKHELIGENYRGYLNAELQDVVDLLNHIAATEGFNL